MQAITSPVENPFLILKYYRKDYLSFWAAVPLINIGPAVLDLFAEKKRRREGGREERRKRLYICSFSFDFVVKSFFH